MRRVLCTIATGPHVDLLALSAPTFEGYARRHGYDLHVVRQDPSPERPPPWGKIRLMQELFDRAEAVDEILWIDADAVVVDDRRDLADELAPGDLMAMVAHVTPEGDDPIPNSGVWFLRNDPAVSALLEAVWACERHIDHKWWENAAVLECLGYDLTPRVHLVAPTPLWHRTRFLGTEWNSVPVDPSDAPRIVHFPGMPLAERMEAMRTAARM